MARNQHVRLAPALLQADMDALTALASIETYSPSNTSYTAVGVNKKLAAMKAAQATEVNAANALAAARDAAAIAEWDFHNAILGAKEQIIAQYGKSSNEVQALGLKKKSEYKAPTRKAKAA